jgi:hypothetical protein
MATRNPKLQRDFTDLTASDTKPTRIYIKSDRAYKSSSHKDPRSAASLPNLHASLNIACGVAFHIAICHNG